MNQRALAIARDIEFGFLDASVNAEQLYNPELIANTTDNTMLWAMKKELARSERFIFSVAFITSSGLAMLKQALYEFPGQGTIITSRYLDFNEPDVFRELLNLDNVEVLVDDGVEEGFHAKGYLFEQADGLTAIVGSSNLTDRALKVNQEWNIRFTALPDGEIVEQLHAAIRRQRQRAQPLTDEWIADYERLRQQRSIIPRHGRVVEATAEGERILPNRMQAEALDALQHVIDEGEKKAVIISATGTGKTILAALAVRNANPARLLFIVHREQILQKALQEFQKVLQADPDDFGLFVGGKKEIDARYVFASYQSLARPETLPGIDPRAFDYIIIDEVHRAGADSYRRLLEHFRPEFLLGLTATPERTDGFNIYELFDYNVPYEIRLHDALRSKMLVPFHYYGVADFEDSRGVIARDDSTLDELLSAERVDYLLEMLRVYGYPRGVKGLMFCSRTREAQLLSEKLNERSLNGCRLRTVALSGADTQAKRDEAVRRLAEGELDYILTVDIFNEGIDIPVLNQIVMLRATESSIIFTQQLGRGLRKAEGKDHLRVIDFIGNYANNYLIPIALTGDNSANKDSLREKIVSSETKGVELGTSSINFDRISQERILTSLAKARLDGKREFKKMIAQLEQRLGQIPCLRDFARFDTVDPFVIGSKYNDYWSLLHSLRFVERGPSPQEARYLKFLSSEILNGLRPHEALLLQKLLTDREITREEFSQLLDDADTAANPEVLSSVERMLTLEFFSTRRRKAPGDIAIIRIKGDVISLDPEFAGLYFAYAASDDRAYTSQSFRAHVDDIVDTSLFLTQAEHSWRGELLVGNRYSRKDVCRLLLWDRNEESTMYGYKVDKATSTCPIFVTYDKHPDVPASTRYLDSFVSPSVMNWYSRSGRTLESNELQPILGGEVALHLFVKKSDAEGTDFFYLGEAESKDPEQTTMRGEGGREHDVVTMNLELDSPVELGLYRYLVDTGVVDADS
ncbi:DUF3427 domain-containing protein [Corynebacterium yudongzhengii]|uniref:DUF3427 domain-containing protein n=1 Tax=Corynebacterium yudongzhengii TaxID=2080740 RepID=A0A2U1T9P0_9CORY|nr:DEAD/DEAH box helicase [Corynebacterium yudongzhengii]AWB81163.1 DUF3427 domain-containing protein [Corynebacterium yudongzhengii]PWC02702.1 DUF3427 domain-containing protein [Corynebacterium yudongzhengii]